jgi:hypothetical protein
VARQQKTRWVSVTHCRNICRCVLLWLNFMGFVGLCRLCKIFMRAFLWWWWW